MDIRGMYFIIFVFLLAWLDVGKKYAYIAIKSKNIMKKE